MIVKESHNLTKGHAKRENDPGHILLYQIEEDKDELKSAYLVKKHTLFKGSRISGTIKIVSSF